MDMKVKAGGLDLKNPVILASAGYTTSLSGFKLHAGSGYGAIVCKTVTKDPLAGAPNPTVFWYDRDEKKLLSGVSYISFLL